MREGEEQGRLTPALGWLLLRGLPYPEHKTINVHGLSGHYVSTTVRFGVREVSKIDSYLLGSLCGSLVLNRRVSKFLETLGHVFCRFVPQRHKFV